MDDRTAATDNEAPLDEDVSFEPATLLQELKAAIASEEPRAQVAELALDDITLMPDLFQPRDISDKHITDLTRAIKQFSKVEPVTVLISGDKAVLVDGHHRIEAYRRAGVTTGIPVRYFEGTPEEAVLEAGRANSQAKLTMTARERQDFAWRLVQLGGHSKAAIVRAAGISSGQIAIMRRARKTLGTKAFDYSSWWRAREAAAGHPDEMSEEDRENWKQELAERYADSLAKHFSTKLGRHADVAAMALAIYFGKRLPEIVSELRSFLPEDDADDDQF